MRRLFQFLLTGGAIFVGVWNFIGIDKRSHSISETLLNFVPMLALVIVIYLLAFIVINDIDLIFAKGHKFIRR